MFSVILVSRCLHLEILCLDAYYNFAAAFGAILHVISTSLLGITAITMANTIAGEETVHQLASLLLIILGACYVLLFMTGRGSHSHSQNQPMEKMAVAGLVLVPALSPCATTLPVFLAVGNSSSMMVLAIIVLLFRYQFYRHKALLSVVHCATSLFWEKETNFYKEKWREGIIISQPEGATWKKRENFNGDWLYWGWSIKKFEVHTTSWRFLYGWILFSVPCMINDPPLRKNI